ncbi:hypothetical protein CYMTET_55237 [Cymbomonas tetramitiformis]|uniref:MYND-type domain-containing protein n=1 Tax=Cymbomonas tetramitiformis TaxID=36881 RepID=A0AAE0BFH3_9CHLO|nr:hypothetical protein CYMTET_55237 [Cymbomonas tetramitiformis]|eukprot:gene3506-4407_t
MSYQAEISVAAEKCPKATELPRADPEHESMLAVVEMYPMYLKYENGQTKFLKDEKGYTILHAFAFLGKLAPLKAMLGVTPDYLLNERNEEGRTALQVAKEKGHAEVVAFLMDEVRRRAIRVRWKDEIDKGLEWKDEATGVNVLHLAAGNGQLEMVKLLIERGPTGLIEETIATGHHTALRVASIRGHDEVVDYLLEQRGEICLKALRTRRVRGMLAAWRRFATMRAYCGGCLRPATRPDGELPMKLCGACRLVAYCSEACQRRDWQAQHKHQCGHPIDCS